MEELVPHPGIGALVRLALTEHDCLVESGDPPFPSGPLQGTNKGTDESAGSPARVGTDPRSHTPS